MEIYDQLNIKSVTENIAGEFINKAFVRLEKVTVNKKRKAEIIQLAESLIDRQK